LASEIRIVLNNAFKYDRVCAYRALFKIHCGMVITRLEMTPAVCSVESRVMACMGNMILHDKLTNVGADEVLFMYRSIQRNLVLCHKFKEITSSQVDRVLEKLWLL